MKPATSLAGVSANVGQGPRFSLMDIGHPDYAVLIEGDTGFWTLVPRAEAGEYLLGDFIPQIFMEHQEHFQREMQTLRFELIPSAVYFNPTERCNLNCSYCYIPSDIRLGGMDMPPLRLLQALEMLSDYFGRTLPEGVMPQIIFHGSEPMMVRDAVFAGIERYGNRFRFGIQTNGTMLDDAALAFIQAHQVSLGLSLDAPVADIADQTRKNWQGRGVYGVVAPLLDRLADYPNYSVICTVTQTNVDRLTDMVEFLHGAGVRVAMLNPVRCTQPGGRDLKPDDQVFARHFSAALERSHDLFQATGRKLVIANFANILIGIVAPLARRLMCDISPCGGGRCFFALSARGDLFPCSEFIGIPEFRGGNLFNTPVEDILRTRPFQDMTSRKVEDFEPCRSCAIRHFCGAPCPAEIYMCSQTLHAPAPYCEFYVEQAKFAFRVIAAGQVDNYVWDGWKEGTEQSFALPTISSI